MYCPWDIIFQLYHIFGDFPYKTGAGKETSGGLAREGQDFPEEDAVGVRLLAQDEQLLVGRFGRRGDVVRDVGDGKAGAVDDVLFGDAPDGSI